MTTSWCGRGIGPPIPLSSPFTPVLNFSKPQLPRCLCHRGATSHWQDPGPRLYEKPHDRTVVSFLSTVSGRHLFHCPCSDVELERRHRAGACWASRRAHYPTRRTTSASELHLTQPKKQASSSRRPMGPESLLSVIFRELHPTSSPPVSKARTSPELRFPLRSQRVQGAACDINECQEARSELFKM